MQTTGASQYVVERRSLVRVLVAAHDCRRPQVLLYLAAVRDGPSPNCGLPGVADRDRDHDEQLDHARDDHYQDDPRVHAQLRWLRRRVGHRQLVPPFAHLAGRLARPELRHEPVDRAAAQSASAQRAALVPAFACQMQGGRGAGSCVSADAQRIGEHLGYLHSHVVPPFKRNRTGSYSRASRLGCHRRLDRGVHLAPLARPIIGRRGQAGVWLWWWRAPWAARVLARLAAVIPPGGPRLPAAGHGAGPRGQRDQSERRPPRSAGPDTKMAHRGGSATWMQTTGAVLVAVRRCSSVRVRMLVQGSRNALGLLYLTAVRS